MNNDSPISRLYAYLSVGNVYENTILPSAVLKSAHATPHSVSRPTLTIGKRQMREAQSQPPQGQREGEEAVMEQCLFCGAIMLGDGASVPYHCENCDPPSDTEPDAGPLFCAKEVKPLDQFLTGSSLVIGIEPKDRDIVCLFNNEYEIDAFSSGHGSDTEVYGDSLFLSFRESDVNYICTANLEFFHRFKAYSGVVELLQIRDRDHRIKIAKACLYWDGPKS